MTTRLETMRTVAGPTGAKRNRSARPTPGTVYLVGAGPGDPELITVRGLRCLQRADVVIFDRLVHADLLDEAPVDAERIFVGKSAGLHVVAQPDIQALLVERARRGLTVVRLKGGDPFVFGRGGEEVAALVEANLPWEVVPAVSSAIGVPARAGIPVTHRGVAASFAVVTAHRADDPSIQNAPDWAALARIDTVVVLMGVAALSNVVTQLRRHGRSTQTPIALIELGTLPNQRVVTGTLATIVQQATAAAVRAPATIVVGDVVSLRHADLDEAMQPTAWPRPAWHPPTQPHHDAPLSNRRSRHV